MRATGTRDTSIGQRGTVSHVLRLGAPTWTSSLAALWTQSGAHPHRPTFSTALPGMLDDAILGLKPFHGAGNGADELDEQWEAQQTILRERKGHFDKQALKKKYVGGGPGAFMTEAMRRQAPADVVPSASEWTAPGTTKKAEAKKFRFPWEKKGSAP